jgi:hypothetical protein
MSFSSFSDWITYLETLSHNEHHKGVLFERFIVAVPHGRRQSGRCAGSAHRASRSGPRSEERATDRVRPIEIKKEKLHKPDKEQRLRSGPAVQDGVFYNLATAGVQGRKTFLKTLLELLEEVPGTIKTIWYNSGA